MIRIVRFHKVDGQRGRQRERLMSLIHADEQLRSDYASWLVRLDKDGLPRRQDNCLATAAFSLLGNIIDGEYGQIEEDRISVLATGFQLLLAERVKLDGTEDDSPEESNGQDENAGDLEDEFISREDKDFVCPTCSIRLAFDYSSPVGSHLFRWYKCRRCGHLKLIRSPKDSTKTGSSSG
jgi:hypothetical protein